MGKLSGFIKSRGKRPCRLDNYSDKSTHEKPTELRNRKAFNDATGANRRANPFNVKTPIAVR